MHSKATYQSAIDNLVALRKLIGARKFARYGYKAQLNEYVAAHAAASE